MRNVRRHDTCALGGAGFEAVQAPNRLCQLRYSVSGDMVAFDAITKLLKCFHMLLGVAVKMPQACEGVVRLTLLYRPSCYNVIALLRRRVPKRPMLRPRCVCRFSLLFPHRSAVSQSCSQRRWRLGRRHQGKAVVKCIKSLLQIRVHVNEQSIEILAMVSHFAAIGLDFADPGFPVCSGKLHPPRRRRDSCS